MSSPRIRKITLCGMMIALGMILGYLEHLVPVFVGIYGIKLGLANLTVLSLLYLTDKKTSLFVHSVRILLSGILFGNVFSLIYSATGGLFSFFIMVLLKKCNKFSLVGISICGGIAHNLAQLVAAMIMVDQLRIAFYLPVLLIAGALAGFLVGVCSLPVIRNRALQRFCQ